MKLYQESHIIQHDSSHPQWRKTGASLSLQWSVQQKDSAESQLSSNVVSFHFVKTSCERSRSWTSRFMNCEQLLYSGIPTNTLKFTCFSSSKRLHCTSGSVLVELLFHISLLSMHHVGTADEDWCLLECNSVLSWWLNLLWAVDLCAEWLVWVRLYSWQHSSLLIPHLQCPLLPCLLLASWTPAKLEETNNRFTVLLVLCISTELLSKSDPTIYT
jgi:hypothetical protein